MSARQQVEQWLHQRGFKPKHLRWEHLVSEGDARGRVIFATTKNNYFLTFTETYLGLVVDSRVARPGENWTRGNDLPDGKFSEETLDRAVKAVLLYELREVSDVPSGGPWELEFEWVDADGPDGVECTADHGPCGADGRTCDVSCTCVPCHPGVMDTPGHEVDSN